MITTVAGVAIGVGLFLLALAIALAMRCRQLGQPTCGGNCERLGSNPALLSPG